MLDDSFADFKRQIESREIEVALLELLYDSQRLQIVIEPAAVRTQQFIELSFARVSKGRMADIMNQREGFGKIGVQSQRSGHGARDLRDFESVRETVAEVIGIARGEDLRFCFEAPE